MRARQQHESEAPTGGGGAAGLPQKPATGFERFLEKGMALAGARKGGGGDGKTGATYQTGWAKGLTKGQAIEKARSMYAGLDDSVRQKYEGQANLLDVRSGREIARETQYQNDRAEALGLGGGGGGSEQPGMVPIAVNGPGGRTAWRYVPAQQAGQGAPGAAPAAPGSGTGVMEPPAAPSPAAPPTVQPAPPNQAGGSGRPGGGTGITVTDPKTGKKSEWVNPNNKGPGIFTTNAETGAITKHTNKGAEAERKGFDRWTTETVRPAYSAEAGFEKQAQAPSATPAPPASKENKFSAVQEAPPVERMSHVREDGSIDVQKWAGLSDSDWKDVQAQARKEVAPTPGQDVMANLGNQPGYKDNPVSGLNTPTKAGPVGGPTQFDPNAAPDGYKPNLGSSSPKREEAPFGRTAAAIGLPNANNAIRDTGEYIANEYGELAEEVGDLGRGIEAGAQKAIQAGTQAGWEAAQGVNKAAVEGIQKAQEVGGAVAADIQEIQGPPKKKKPKPFTPSPPVTP